MRKDLSNKLLVHELIYDNTVCRTVPATPDLSIMFYLKKNLGTELVWTLHTITLKLRALARPKRGSGPASLSHECLYHCRSANTFLNRGKLRSGHVTAPLPKAVPNASWLQVIVEQPLASPGSAKQRIYWRDRLAFGTAFVDGAVT